MRTPPLSPRLVALLSALLLASPAALAQQPPSDAKASAFPTARTQGLLLAQEDDVLLLRDEAAGKTYRLHPLAAAVFALSDGKTSPADIAARLPEVSGLDSTEEVVFAALDALADAKLLLARVTPPGSSPIDLVVLSDGVIGSGLVLPTPKEIGAQDAKKVRADEMKAKQQVRHEKRQESDAKAKEEQVQKKSSVRTQKKEKHLEASKKKQQLLEKKQASQEERAKAEQHEKQTLSEAQQAAQVEAKVRTAERLKKAMNSKQTK